jgi:hypothetical protein
MHQGTSSIRWALALSLFGALFAQTAEAQTAPISTIPSGSQSRRLEIVIQDPAAQAPIVTPAEPDKGPLPVAIVGTMISAGKRFAVTESRLLAVGDVVGTYRITEITLDRVACTSGATKRELDMRSGLWSSGAPEAQGE